MAKLKPPNVNYGNRDQVITIDEIRVINDGLVRLATKINGIADYHRCAILNCDTRPVDVPNIGIDNLADGVMELDTSIGEVVSALDELVHYDDTISSLGRSSRGEVDVETS